MTRLVPFDYQGQPVSFTQDGWIDARRMVQRNGNNANSRLAAGGERV